MDSLSRITGFGLGSDPEMFVTSNGNIVSSIGLIGGSKQKPRDLGDGYFIQEDNILVEFNIPVSNSRQSFIDNMETGLELVANELELIGGYKYLIKASEEIDPSLLECKQACVFGCEPDFNVWEQSVNEPPHPKTNLRTCGGHVHVGYNEPDLYTTILLGKCLDIMLGLNSIILDTDSRRRELYGKAGCVRFKEYGLEYRSLSNFWIGDPKLVGWIWDQVERAVSMVNNVDTLEVIDNYAVDVQRAINTSDQNLALKIEKDIKQRQLVTI